MPAEPLRQRELPCGCVLARYQSGDGIAVWIVDTLGDSCKIAGHRLNAMLAPAEPVHLKVDASVSRPSRD